MGDGTIEIMEPYVEIQQKQSSKMVVDKQTNIDFKIPSALNITDQGYYDTPLGKLIKQFAQDDQITSNQRLQNQNIQFKEKTENKKLNQINTNALKQAQEDGMQIENGEIKEKKVIQNIFQAMQEEKESDQDNDEDEEEQLYFDEEDDDMEEEEEDSDYFVQQNKINQNDIIEIQHSEDIDFIYKNTNQGDLKLIEESLKAQFEKDKQMQQQQEQIKQQQLLLQQQSQQNTQQKIEQVENDYYKKGQNNQQINNSKEQNVISEPKKISKFKQERMKDRGQQN